MDEVLYGDYNGHMRPLSRMYFSLDSRCLVADHPESVQEEVESHFCPHCNALCTTPEAQSNGNRCLQCLACPCCGCVLSPSPTSLEACCAPPPPSSVSASSPAGGGGGSALEYCLQCLYCQWTSEASGLVASEPAALVEAVAAGEKTRDGDLKVVDALLAGMKRMEDLRGTGGSSGGGGGKGGRSRTGSGVSGGGGGGGGGSSGSRGGLPATPADATGPWKVADIEKAVSQRKEAVKAASRAVAPPSASPAVSPSAAGAAQEKIEEEKAPPVTPPWSPRADTDGPDPALWGLASGQETSGLAERLEVWGVRGGGGGDGGDGGDDATAGARAGEGGGSGSRWGSGVGVERREWPRRVRLRTRLGKRCRKDLAAGRAGILIKATFNPLEGDSSGAKKGGKWFKKDCSAALLVPRVTVAGLPSFSALLGTTPPREGHDGPPPPPPPASGRTGEGGQLSLTLRLANPQDNLLRVRVAEDPSAGNAAWLDGNSPDGAEGDGSAATEAENTASRAGGKVGSITLGTTTPEWGTRRGYGVTPAGVAAATASAAAAGVTVKPKFSGKGSEWVRLEGKEDEFLRQPGDRHRFPEGLLHQDRGGDDDDGEGDDSGGSCTTPVLLHQQGDVAWVQVPLGMAAADRVRAAVVEAGSSYGVEAVVVTVRLFLVMREGEEERGGEEGKGAGGVDGDVWMPIAVRFPLSKCLP